MHECMRVLTDGGAGAQHDGNALLRLEHVLPLLDDFVVVSDLKELVCESLAAHAASCAKSKKVLDAVVCRAKNLRTEIRALTNSGASGTTRETPGNITFPCGHVWKDSQYTACPLCSPLPVGGPEAAEASTNV